ncbi:MAG: FKBP-type peptidyl-prolyl cis-trans isomerase [Spirochaetes bacterium]|nr:FKBP-type peptidyl-prolyl cis-trans isomerase [Spirochaetota bacterium]
MIDENSVVTIEYSVKDENGVIIDSSRDKEMLTFRMNEKRFFNKVLAELLGKNKKDYLEIVLNPEDAYGKYDKELIQKVPRKHFGDIVDIKKDMQLQITSGSGTAAVRILDYDNSNVVVDANHPLAGQKIRIEIYIADVK